VVAVVALTWFLLSDGSAVDHAILEAGIKVMSDMCKGSVSQDDALSSDDVKRLQDVILSWQAEMQEYRTAKLWLLYMRMVILRTLIRSSRTGNWKLYIQSLNEMIPYLESAGHNNYVKSLVLFLGKMNKLPVSHPIIFQKFMEGLFVVRQQTNRPHRAGPNG